MKRKSLLIDLGYAGRSSAAGKRYHLYRCECGTEKEIIRSDVNNGHTTSCGCHRAGLLRTHGWSGTPTYKCWENMKNRCNGVGGEKACKYYSDRGITYTLEWVEFENFLKDMGERPDGCEIDRIDNDGGYSKENCRWTSPVTQARNGRLIRATNTSGYRGVSWDKARQKWAARIGVSGGSKYLGRFDSKIHAAKAYNAEARKHEGFPLNEV